MRVKICGITNLEAAREIVHLGATALGFICVPKSPRYVSPLEIGKIVAGLNSDVDKIGVFANNEITEIASIAKQTKLTGIQLHGEETPQFCQQLRSLIPSNIELIKAFRIETPESLMQTANYLQAVDAYLLDAYHPQMLGGTGHTLNWQDLSHFQTQLPWFLAGGLKPKNIAQALSQVTPDGIDLSSGVERSPGNKDLGKVRELFQTLKQISP